MGCPQDPIYTIHPQTFDELIKEALFPVEMLMIHPFNAVVVHLDPILKFCEQFKMRYACVEIHSLECCNVV